MTAVKARFTLSHGELCVSQGNIVQFSGDAIVNAADHKCIYGKGVDGAINKVGGAALVAARRELPVVAGTRETRCPVGEARWTTRHARMRCHFTLPFEWPNRVSDPDAQRTVLKSGAQTDKNPYP